MPKFPDNLLNQYLETATHAADRARTVTQKWFRSDFEITSKEDRTPVTMADHQTEQVIRDLILTKHPDHGFYGEESGQESNGSPWQWVVDPIDGTKSFATGMPTFGTLISLIYENTPIIGVIDHAMLDERWIGVQGKHTTHNGRACQSRSTDTIQDATAYTTTSDMFNEATAKQVHSLTSSCKFRVFGGDCYAYGLLASGYNDLVCEADLKPYDFFALGPVIAGAGGIITDWQGNKLMLNSNGQVLASANESLHAKAIEKLNST